MTTSFAMVAVQAHPALLPAARTVAVLPVLGRKKLWGDRRMGGIIVG